MTTTSPQSQFMASCVARTHAPVRAGPGGPGEIIWLSPTQSRYGRRPVTSSLPSLAAREEPALTSDAPLGRLRPPAAHAAGAERKPSPRRAGRVLDGDGHPPPNPAGRCSTRPTQGGVLPQWQHGSQAERRR